MYQSRFQCLTLIDVTPNLKRRVNLKKDQHSQSLKLNQLYTKCQYSCQETFVQGFWFSKKHSTNVILLITCFLYLYYIKKSNIEIRKREKF